MPNSERLIPITPRVSKAISVESVMGCLDASRSPPGSKAMDRPRQTGVVIHMTCDTIRSLDSSDTSSSPFSPPSVSFASTSSPGSCDSDGDRLDLKTHWSSTQRKASKTSARSARPYPNGASPRLAPHTGPAVRCSQEEDPCSMPPKARSKAAASFVLRSVSRPKRQATSITASTFVAKIMVRVETLRSKRASFFAPSARPCNTPMARTAARLDRCSFELQPQASATAAAQRPALEARGSSCVGCSAKRRESRGQSLSPSRAGQSMSPSCGGSAASRLNAVLRSVAPASSCFSEP
mmetsp:Transcript_4143/g.8499  ORF Transcript_4143/g.8499 Transcript_4143/m.8499 type:complete len:295 (+) Transcript_4143:325-1209(+)